jgi:hypothetical protein
VKFGDSNTVPVYVARGPGSAALAKVTLKAQSESDPAKTETATCVVSAANAKLSKQSRGGMGRVEKNLQKW